MCGVHDTQYYYFLLLLACMQQPKIYVFVSKTHHTSVCAQLKSNSIFNKSTGIMH